jgi:hypothetical protein
VNFLTAAILFSNAFLIVTSFHPKSLNREARQNAAENAEKIRGKFSNSRFVTQVTFVTTREGLLSD